ncbi:MAG: ATP-binding domain-containing protein, partial [Opitutales bacterium]|nr:ATP-binding domain-containing protein [Opitutales bacterium]
LIPYTFSTHQKTSLASFSKLGRFQESNQPLGGCLVNLSHSHRRSRQEPSNDELGNLCDAIREGRGEDALTMVRASEDSLYLIESLDDPAIPQLLRKGFESFNHSTDPQKAISALGKFRILCAHNQGRFGVDGWNERVQKIFPSAVDNPLPVVVGANDYSIGLFNGDDGVIMNNIACFPDDQRQKEISCSRLPGHQIGYATTIHRSQGSEFEQVLIVLPPADARLLSRELLYVATSRAKSKVILIGDPQSLLAAVERREDSRSGVLELVTTVK